MNDPQRPQGHDTVEAEVRVIDDQPQRQAEGKPQVEATAPRFGDALRNWFSRGSVDAKELAGAVRDEAAIANGEVQAYVRKEPLKSVLIAAAAGAVLTGLMAAGRKRRGRGEGA
jgi:ElaB/YqjD/DUF883 family membrane-anchored ribosome-binding protein